jgi:hypothetical protein
MSSFKKTYLKRDFAAGGYLSEDQNPYPPPPPLTHHTCIHHTYSHRGMGGELNQKEGKSGNRGENSSQSWVENTNMTEGTQEIGYKL